MMVIKSIEAISLKKKFAAIFILAAVIPILVTSVFTLRFLQLDSESQIDAQNRFRNQVKFNVILALRTLSSDATLLSNSNSFLDFLTVPTNLRVYSENRLFGMAHEVSRKSQLRPSFIVYTSDKVEIFKFIEGPSNILEIGNDRLSKVGYSFDVKNQQIFYVNEIKYDDQQLQGPTASLRGYLVSVVPISKIRQSISELKNIIKIEQNLDSEKMEIELVDFKEARRFSITFFIVFASLLLVVAVLSAVFFVNRSILMPISKITEDVLSENSNTNVITSENEIDVLREAIKTYQKNIKQTQEALVTQSRLSTLVSIASQVAHDIRSPLTALNMVIETLNKLPEEKRIIIRSAIQRINDIANDLLLRGKNAQLEKVSLTKGAMTKVNSEEPAVVMLSSLVDSLVSEKRIQYRNKISVLIDVDLSKSYGLFAKLPPNEFKRVLSNLINNSVEAFPNESGRVFVTLLEFDGKIKLDISDNGKGIPAEFLSKLGEKGFSFGKNGKASGSGLGLYHAKITLENAGGMLVFENFDKVINTSTLSFKVVTTISIILPKVNPPSWFVKRLDIPTGSVVSILDDDHSIHNVWQGRFSSLGSDFKNIEICNFTSFDVFKKWLENYNDSKIAEKMVFLVDYELIGQDSTGLDVIEELKIQKQAILVTSRYEEIDILERCKRMGVRLIPKAMAGFLPMSILKIELNYDAILIDDDELIRTTWSLAAKTFGKKFISFSGPKEFFACAKTFSLNTPIYIDSNLGENLKGEVIAEQICKLGFENLFITTGYDVSEIAGRDFIKGVIDKKPIWE